VVLKMSQNQLTFPPFTPNRVVAQYLFCRVTDGGYDEQAMPYIIRALKVE
jgi:phytoene/squalene synthetase